MSVPLPRYVRDLRRRVLAQPGITPLPVCPRCTKPVQPSEFGREACKTCEDERAAVSAAWDAEFEAALPTLAEYLAGRLSDYQAGLVRQGLYVARPGMTPVALDRCRHAVTPDRQCDGPQDLRRGEHWVCRAHGEGRSA
jgi:hypothetical protein